VRDSTRRRTVAEVNLGLCRIELGELARAREHFETALALDRERDDPGYDAWSLFGLAGVALEGGEVEEAARWLDETERQAARAGSKELLGLIEAARARVHLAAGDPAAARSSAASAARIAAEVGAGDPVAAAAEASAAIAAVEGRCADAEGHAARLAAELGSEAYPVERALAAAAAASCWDAAGRSEEAARAFELARRGAETTDSARVRRAVDEVAARLAR
jgi:ATP/maltotriose-dependent transcriptional regulator MalT